MARLISELKRSMVVQTFRRQWFVELLKRSQAQRPYQYERQRAQV